LKFKLKSSSIAVILKKTNVRVWKTRRVNMEKLKVGVLGATGMVGQRFLS